MKRLCAALLPATQGWALGRWLARHPGVELTLVSTEAGQLYQRGEALLSYYTREHRSAEELAQEGLAVLGVGRAAERELAMQELLKRCPSCGDECEWCRCS